MSISFYPVHEYAKSKTKALVPEDYFTDVDPETGLQRTQIDQILTEGKNFRYVDNLNVLFSEILSPESTSLYNSPFSKSGGAIKWEHQPKVAIIGGGMSGLMVAFQLGKIGMKVDVFEAGPPPITPTETGANSPEEGNLEAIKSENGAGRIRPTRLIPDDPSLLVELGAMRFPSNSFLFWHYISILEVSRTNTYTEFPNVGKIPTLFRNKKSVEAFWPSNGELPFSGDDSALNIKHIEAFLNYTPTGGPHELTISGVKQIVKKPNPSKAELKSVEMFWTAAVAAVYRVSYKGFLISLGFTSDEIERIGFMGVGTGGFAPLFDVSVLDIMRLFIWDYAAELAVPELWHLPERLREAARLHGVTFHYSTPVRAVAYSRKNKNYTVAYGSVKVEYVPGYDYLVLATSHTAAQKLLVSSESQAGSSMSAHAPDPVYPYYDKRYRSLSTAIRLDLENQGYMPAVKLFHSIYGPTSVQSKYANPWTTLEPKKTVTYDKSVRAMFGTFAYTQYGVDIGVTYALPVPNKPFATSDVLAGLHYSWGVDAHDVRKRLLDISPEVRSSIESKGIYQGRYPLPKTFSLNVSLAVLDRFVNADVGRYVVGDPLTGIGQYFGDANVDPGEPYAHYAIVDWEKVPFIWLGFKLDSPGKGAHLIYSYKTVTEATINDDVWDTQTATGAYIVNSSVKGLYFSGDSFSHYGGWVEGAFHSGLTTTAGIIQAACTAQFSEKWSDHVRQEIFTAMIAKARDPYSY